MDEITIQVTFFGAFRKFGKGLNFSVPAGSTVATIKNTLQEQLNGEGLVSESVLANDNAILRDSDVLRENAKLSVLPPVCGG